MSLSREEVSYLREFDKEIHRRGSSGWLDCEEAGRRSNVDYEGGHFALRLSGLGYLTQKNKYPEFRITPRGVEAASPWMQRHWTMILSFVKTALGLSLR